MATIVKVPRKSGHVYKVVIRRKGSRQLNKCFSHKKEAQQWAQKAERAIALGHSLSADARVLTLSRLIKEYRADYRGKDVSRAGHLDWWDDEYGALLMTQVTPGIVRDGIKLLATSPGDRPDRSKKRIKGAGKPRSDATLNRYRSTLAAVWNYGVENYSLNRDDNPCRHVRAKREYNQRTRWLSPDERKRLLDACRSSEYDRLYLLVLLAITSGARRSEMTQLRYRDIDLQAGRAMLHTTKNGEARVLVLVPGVVAEIKRLPRPLDSSACLFPSSIDIHASFEYRKYWDKALIAAQVKGFRFHDLRHTAASILASSGASVLEIADVLGHKSLASTKRYSHLCTERKAELVNRVLGDIHVG